MKITPRCIKCKKELSRIDFELTGRPLCIPCAAAAEHEDQNERILRRIRRANDDGPEGG
jgi:hypothetical protein